ncbi:unnamed protein product [Arctia plantaginis]|uniref:Pseudouridine synthase I TruA alpha/beta domain-containing protein n=1 Tax=Arctia plantaginis TaxID=874455 RepID=A0A8S0ZJN0_ARCPL|nr:unnamed protein product [Arctia plantaginis]
MEENNPKRNKQKSFTREELLNKDKNELVEKIIALEKYNLDLKNIIRKKGEKSEAKHGTKSPKNFDFTKCHYRRILLRILYFGWDYQGFVVQDDTNQTIEHHLFHALTKSCLIECREKSNYHRSGRTDKGVSAFGQVISITIRSKFPVDQQYTLTGLKEEIPYCKILNRLLPKDIRAVAWMPIPLDKPQYSARFDCTKRQYKYYFPRSTLDIEAMREACGRLLGSNDYRNMCKMDVGNNVTQYRRELVKAELIPVTDSDTEHPTAMYYLLIEGNAFLWHQIRCIMGVLLLIGQGKESPEIITELLNVEKNPRKPQYSMALNVPLNLFRCSFDLDGTWIQDRDELRMVITQLQNEWSLKTIQSTMIKDVINELEEQLSVTETEHSSGVRSNKDRVVAYTDCLLQGVKPKVYTPLMKRSTCSSLEDRIEHYAKRRKLKM